MFDFRKTKFIQFGKLIQIEEMDEKIDQWKNNLIEIQPNLKEKISRCEWEKDSIKVSVQKGKMISTMGFYKDKNFYLLPEEAT